MNHKKMITTHQHQNLKKK